MVSFPTNEKHHLVYFHIFLNSLKCYQTELRAIHWKMCAHWPVVYTPVNVVHACITLHYKKEKYFSHHLYTPSILLSEGEMLSIVSKNHAINIQLSFILQ